MLEIIPPALLIGTSVVNVVSEFEIVIGTDNTGGTPLETAAAAVDRAPAGLVIGIAAVNVVSGCETTTGRDMTGLDLEAAGGIMPLLDGVAAGTLVTIIEPDFDIVIGTTGGCPTEFEACPAPEVPAGGFLVFEGCATVEAPAPFVTGISVVSVVSDPEIVIGTESIVVGFGVLVTGTIPPLPEVLSADSETGSVPDEGLLGAGPGLTTLFDAPTKVPVVAAGAFVEPVFGFPDTTGIAESALPGPPVFAAPVVVGLPWPGVVFTGCWVPGFPPLMPALVPAPAPLLPALIPALIPPIPFEVEGIGLGMIGFGVLDCSVFDPVLIGWDCAGFEALSLAVLDPADSSLLGCAGVCVLCAARD